MRDTQQKLQLAHQRFELAHEIANIWSWEPDLATGKVVWASRAKGTSLTREDPIQRLLELVHAEDRDRVLAALKSAVDSLQPYAIEFRVVSPEGDLRWIASSGQFYKGFKGEQRMIGVNADITVRKQAERAAEATGRQEMAARLAHEINNPLQGSMHALYLLSQRVAGNDVHQYSAVAQSEARRISQLAKQLLQLYPERPSTPT